ncbi:MAG: hypothetical protein IPL98_03840 [Saprospiraceae bacterium]|nr:hypothetical protein [Saprospiraceae bacterium]
MKILFLFILIFTSCKKNSRNDIKESKELQVLNNFIKPIDFPLEELGSVPYGNKYCNFSYTKQTYWDKSGILLLIKKNKSKYEIKFKINSKVYIFDTNYSELKNAEIRFENELEANNFITLKFILSDYGVLCKGELITSDNKYNQFELFGLCDDLFR